MKYVLRRPLSLIAVFIRLESAAGLLLMAAAALALVLANSPLAPVYHAALATKIGLHWARLSLLHWINDGLLALFFLLVGLAIKRELLAGDLSSVKRGFYPALPRLGAWWCLP